MEDVELKRRRLLAVARARRARADAAPQADFEEAEPDVTGQMATQRTRPEGILSFVGTQLRRFGEAPIVGAMDELQRSPDKGGMLGPGSMSLKDYGRAARGAFRGFTDPESVPRAKEVLTRAGLSDKPITDRMVSFGPGGAEVGSPSPAGVAGFGLEVASPLSVVPFGQIAKGVAKGGYRAAEGTAKGAGKVFPQLEAAGDLMEATRKGVARTGQQRKNVIDELTNPSYQIDAPQMKEIAQKAGITPDILKEVSEPLEYGKLSVSNRNRMAEAQGPGGQKRLTAHNVANEKIEEAYNNEIVRIGGQPLPPEQTGALIRDEVFEGLKNLREQASFTHADVINEFPHMRRQGSIAGKEAENLEKSLNNKEKFAKELIDDFIDPIEKSSAEQILRAVNKIRKKGFSYEGLNEVRDQIGKIAFEKVGGVERIPAYEKKLRDLYFEINDALIGTVKKLDRQRRGQFRPQGEEFVTLADKLEESNKILKEAMDDKSALSKVIGLKGKAGEKIYQNAVLNGDTKTIKAIKRFLSPDAIQRVKASFLNDVTASGDFINYKTTLNNFKRKGTIVRSLFDDPNELANINDFLRLGDRIGPPLMPGSAGQLDFQSTLFKQLSQPVSNTLEEFGKIKAIKAQKGKPNSFITQPIPYTPFKQPGVLTGRTIRQYGIETDER